MLTISSRIGSHEVYRQISKDNLASFSKSQAEYLALEAEKEEILASADYPKDPPDAYYPIMDRLSIVGDERHRAYVLCVVFAAMYLEAFIYDYAAWKLGDDYVQKYLDRIDLAAKWIVIPHLVIGKQIPEGNHSLGLLRALVTRRNGLVHLKSQRVPETEKLRDFFARQEKEYARGAQDSYCTIAALLKDLGKLDPDHPGFASVRDIVKRKRSGT